MTHTSFGPGVTPATAEALLRRGITSLFPIQVDVVPVADTGQDILARSPTGSGKTIAFGIPLVQALDPNMKGVQALVLVPTRELAVQVGEELTSLSLDARVATVYGGVKQGSQVTQLRTANILVACPGRLEDLIQQGYAKLDRVHTLVLDEADRMLDMGFVPIVERILAKVPKQRHTMLFSATLDERIEQVASRHTNNPVTIATAPPSARPNTVDHAFLPAVHEDKTDLLIDLLEAEERDLAVVFVRTKRGAARIAKRLAKRGLRTAAMHGDMVQNQRLRELRRFENGEADVLVATDVFARGIDLDRITVVINFDPPGETEDYVHRAGRTGRAGRDGLAVTFVMDDQRADVQKIADELGLVDEFTRNGLEYVEKRVGGSQTRAATGRPRRNRGGRSRAGAR
ncbi:MAG: box helicase domain protein [Thermoleophilia bacterium]|nr:box helicase domain protein [Thermoleophilia bacterium]